MADSQPLYTWRDPKQQQPQTMFGALGGSYFGNQLNNKVNQAGGAQSPVAPKADDGGGGFNVPGGSAAGFNSAAFAPQGPASQPPANGQPATFGEALRQNPLAQPLIRSASENILQGLQPNPQPSMSSMFALNEYNKSETEALRQAKETSALNGRAFTGQIGGDTQDYLANKLIPARQNFLGQLQGQEQQQQQAKQQNAFGNLATLAGLGQQGELTKEQLAQQASEGAANRASSEKIAFAGLDVQKQQLAQEAMQFTSKQDYDKWALGKNLDAQTQAQIWQAAENEKNRQLTAGQGELDRTLQKYITDANINLDSKKLAESVRQFNTQQDFQKWATQAGLDADTAKLVWQAQQNDIQRKQDLGIHLSDQENNVLLESMREKSDQAMASLQHTLNLDTLDKQNAHDTLMKQMDQSFADKMTKEGYNHEEAMAATKQEYALALEQQGYDHQTALQASEQMAQAKEHDKDLAQQKELTEAQMAQSHDFFKEDLMQKYNFKQQDLDLANRQLDATTSEWAQQFGLDKSSTDLQNLQSTTAMLMSMAGDDPDMQRFAAETFYKGISNMKDATGAPVMDPAQQKIGLLSIKASSFKEPTAFTTWAQGQTDASGQRLYSDDAIKQAAGNVASTTSAKASADAFGTIVDKTGAFATADDKDKFKSDMLKYSQLASGLPSGTVAGTGDDEDVNHMLDDGYRKLAAAGVDTSKLYSNTKAGTYDTHTAWNASQLGMDYAIYTRMQKSGLNEASAVQALTSLVGQQRANAALSLESKNTQGGWGMKSGADMLAMLKAGVK